MFVFSELTGQILATKGFFGVQRPHFVVLEGVGVVPSVGCSPFQLVRGAVYRFLDKFPELHKDEAVGVVPFSRLWVASPFLATTMRVFAGPYWPIA